MGQARDWAEICTVKISLSKKTVKHDRMCENSRQNLHPPENASELLLEHGTEPVLAPLYSSADDSVNRCDADAAVGATQHSPVSLSSDISTVASGSAGPVAEDNLLDDKRRASSLSMRTCLRRHGDHGGRRDRRLAA